jgi:hypothetical protein
MDPISAWRSVTAVLFKTRVINTFSLRPLSITSLLVSCVSHRVASAGYGIEE